MSENNENTALSRDSMIEGMSKVAIERQLSSRTAPDLRVQIQERITELDEPSQDVVGQAYRLRRALVAAALFLVVALSVVIVATQMPTTEEHSKEIGLSGNNLKDALNQNVKVHPFRETTKITSSEWKQLEPKTVEEMKRYIADAVQVRLLYHGIYDTVFDEYVLNEDLTVYLSEQEIQKARALLARAEQNVHGVAGAGSSTWIYFDQANGHTLPCFTWPGVFVKANGIFVNYASPELAPPEAYWPFFYGLEERARIRARTAHGIVEDWRELLPVGDDRRPAEMKIIFPKEQPHFVFRASAKKQNERSDGTSFRDYPLELISNLSAIQRLSFEELDHDSFTELLNAVNRGHLPRLVSLSAEVSALKYDQWKGLSRIKSLEHLATYHSGEPASIELFQEIAALPALKFYSFNSGLKETTYGTSEIRSRLQALWKSKSIETLELMNMLMPLDSECFAGMSENRTLKSLTISRSKLPTSNIPRGFGQNLEALYLHDCLVPEISDFYARMCAAGKETQPNLKKLELRGVDFFFSSSDGNPISAIGQVFPNLKQLSLQRTVLEDSFASSLGRLFEAPHCKISHLDLSDTEIGDRTIEALGRSSSLRELRLLNCYEISESVLSSFLGQLKDCRVKLPSGEWIETSSWSEKPEEQNPEKLTALEIKDFKELKQFVRNATSASVFVNTGRSFPESGLNTFPWQSSRTKTFVAFPEAGFIKLRQALLSAETAKLPQKERLNKAISADKLIQLRLASGRILMLAHDYEHFTVLKDGGRRGLYILNPELKPIIERIGAKAELKARTRFGIVEDWRELLPEDHEERGDAQLVLPSHQAQLVLMPSSFPRTVLSPTEAVVMLPEQTFARFSRLKRLAIYAGGTQFLAPHKLNLPALEWLQLHSVDFSSHELLDRKSPDAWASIASLPSLRRLDILQRHTPLSAKSVRALAASQSLEIFNMDCGFAHHRGPVLESAAVKELWALPKLRVLNLRNCNAIEASAFDGIENCQSLRELDLGGTDVKGAFLDRLATLKRLEKLSLYYHDELSANELKKLAALGDARDPQNQKLRELDLSCIPAVDDALIEELLWPFNMSLERLNLERTKVTDEGLKHLAYQPGLRHLNLSHTTVSDEGIAELKRIIWGQYSGRLPQWLVSLELAYTKVGADFVEALMELAGEAELEFLNLRGCGRITEADAEKIAKAFPKCRIVTPEGKTIGGG